MHTDWRGGMPFDRGGTGFPIIAVDSGRFKTEAESKRFRGDVAEGWDLAVCEAATLNYDLGIAR